MVHVSRLLDVDRQISEYVRLGYGTRVIWYRGHLCGQQVDG